MSMDIATLGIRVDALEARQQLNELSNSGDRASRSMGAAERAADRARSQFSALGSMAKMAAGAIAGIAFTKAVHEISSFETKLLALKSLTNANTSEMKDMEKQARSLGATTAFSAQQTAEAQGVLASAGLKTNEILAATPQVLELAAAGSLDLAKAAEIATGTMRGLGLGLGDLGRINDVFAKVSADTSTNVEQVGEAMKNVAPIAQAFGIRLEDMAASIGVLADNQIKGSEAGNNFKSMLVAIGNETKEKTDLLKQHGLAFADLNIQVKGLQPVLDTLRKANLNRAEAITLFGADAAAAGLILSNNSTKIADFSKALDGASGSAKAQSDILNQGLSKAWDAFLGTLSEAGLQLGDSGLKGSLTDLIHEVTGVIAVYEGMGKEFADSNGYTKEQYENLKNIAGELQIVASAAGGIAVLTTGIWAANTAMIAFNLVTRMNPLVAVATVAAAGIGIVLGQINKAKDEHEKFMASANTLEEANLKIKQQIAKINEIPQATGENHGASDKMLGRLKDELKILVDQRNAIDAKAEAEKNLGKVTGEALVTQIKKPLTIDDNEAKKAREKAVKDALKDAERDANSLQKAYDSVAESMSKAMTKTKDGDNNTAAMQYETTNGTLKALTDTKKQYLIQLATELDYKEKMGKSAEASKTAMQTEIDKYNELTLSAHDFFIEKLKAAGVNEADIPAISAKHDVNTGLEASKSKNDDLQKSLESYGKTLDDANLKTKELGLTNSAIFDGALGGVNTLTGAFSNMVKAIQENVTALDELQKKKLENDTFQPDASKGFTDDYIKQVKLKAANVQKYAAEEKKLNNDNFKSSLTGVRQIASATGQMFAENTTARKVFNAVALAASVAERLADLAGLAVKGAGAMLTQGQGDPYSAFARIAAMGAIVMSIIASVGGAFSGGGGGAATAPPPPTSSDTGTVLGDSSEKSQSINNTYQLLKDIHASEYAELRGINSGVAELSSGITNATTRLFQAGGIKMSNEVIKNKYFWGGIFGGNTSTEQVGGGIATGSASLGNIRDSGNLPASQYATMKKTTKGGWFSDDKVSYYYAYQAIDSATQKALNSVFKSTGDTMFGLAKSLGGNLTQKVNDYIIPAMTVELRGLSGKDAAEKLNGVLSAALDTMSMSVFGPLLAQYQQLGEGMLETSTRIVAEMAIVKDALGMSGLTLTQNIIAVSDAIVQAAGGLKDFQAAFESYFDKFYSDSEKTARTYGQMSSALSDVGLTVAATRAGYRAQIEALNMNNALDQQRYSLLISLSSAADTYYSSLEKISDAMKLMTESNFKTAVDYTRYLSLASLSGVKAATTLLGWDSNTFMPTGQAAVAQLPTLSTPAGTTGNVTEAITNMSNSNTNVAAEIKLLRDQQAAQALAIAQNTQDTAKLLKRWDGDGMPAVRTVA